MFSDTQVAPCIVNDDTSGGNLARPANTPKARFAAFMAVACASYHVAQYALLSLADVCIVAMWLKIPYHVSANNMTKLDELTPAAMRTPCVQNCAVTASRESMKTTSAAVLPAGVAEEVVAPDDPAEGLVVVCGERVLPERYEMYSA